eukprot:TRINITY_DN770_c0_g3_i1.p1 TRINITY_DN770_c0_g3~~TRINITY_DN770_c0_g3_i1.p1  ORF type:complete len:533 (-),score=56.93 TRINITY_DN770_c0_g3_i1:358-1956(-)
MLNLKTFSLNKAALFWRNKQLVDGYRGYRSLVCNRKYHYVTSAAVSETSTPMTGARDFSSGAADTPAWSGVDNPKVCILGGGFGGLYTAIKLDQMMWPRNKKPKITLVDQQERFVFKPMLYELLVNTVQPWEVAPTFQELLAPFQIQVIKGKVDKVVAEKPDADASSKQGGQVFLRDGSSVEYDWLVIALGTEPNLQIVPGAKEHALPFCTYENAVQVNEALTKLKSSSETANIAVVGGNYAGVELAAMVVEALGKGKSDVTVYTTTMDILPDAPQAQVESARKILQQAGVKLRTNTGVQRVLQPASNPNKKVLQITAEEQIEVDLVLWTAGQTPVPGASNTKYDAFPFPKTAKGLLKVENTLRVVDNPRVFALGDVSGLQADQNGLQPATAQVAMQQSDYAAWNIWSSVNGRMLLQFRYQHLGNMMSLGKLQASVALNVPVPYPVSTAISSNNIINGLFSLAGVKVEGGDNGLSIDGPMGGLIRRAAYLYRQPTDEHRVRVGMSWLQQGLKDAQDIAREFTSRLQSTQSPQ